MNTRHNAATTVKTLIDHHAAHQPDNTFLIIPPTYQQVSWRQLAQQMPAIAGLVKQLNLTADQPLAFMMGNSWASVQLLLGGMYNGQAVLPLNIAAGDAQISFILQQSKTSAVVVDKANAPRLQNIVDGTPIQVHVIDKDSDIQAEKSDGLPTNPHTRALLMYTSGTTGMPKGVVHTQQSLIAGGRGTAIAHQLTRTDRALCVLPLYHINGLCVTILAPLFSGGSVVLPDRFRTDNFWQHISKHKCTWFSVVPTLIAYLLAAQDEPPPCPALRFGRSASAPLAPNVQQQFEERFSIPIIETMGLTETAAQILSNPLPPAVRKIGSPGIAFGNQVRVINPQGKTATVGEVGELVVSGDNVMLEYNDNPTETNATFTADGWLLTGDLGYQDADGYFFITGRRKELIIKGGENIAPREIDEALLQHPSIAEAAAFARPCQRYGQRVEAAVTLKAGTTFDQKTLVAHCHKLVGEFKSPDKIHCTQELPRGPSGKVQRLKLAEQFSTIT